MTASYRRPLILDEALDVLASGDVVVAAGCTDLFPATERKRLPGNILDITAIEALSGIGWQDGYLRIGATTTWTEIIRADLPPALKGLQLAAAEVGAMQIQNRGTIAGNLCNASPAADGVPPLLVCDAEVELMSTKAVRRLPLADFLMDPRATRRAADELLSAVLLPKSGLAGRSQFLKLGARDYLVISIAMTAARLVLEDGVVTDAALAVGACGPVATRLPDVEQAMIGRPLAPNVIENERVAAALSPIDDARADASYRADAAAELLRRTVVALGTPLKVAA
ncbi:MAG: FAD binding domain-containing protein [Geminicoccaceae bacterium]